MPTILSSQLHSFHPKGLFQWEDGKFLKTKQATQTFCFNRSASLFYLHVGRHLRYLPPSHCPLECCALTKSLCHISLTISTGLDPEDIGQSIMKVCKAVPSAELCTEEESSLKSLHCTPEDPWQPGCLAGAASHLGFFTLQPCRKSSATFIYTVNKA